MYGSLWFWCYKYHYMIQSYFKIQLPHTVSLCKSDTIAFNDSLKHCVTIDTSWVITRNCYNTMYWFVINWRYKSYLLTHYYIVVQYRFVILSANLIHYRFMDHFFVMIQISYGDSILYVWYNLTWCLNKL